MRRVATTLGVLALLLLLPTTGAMAGGGNNPGPTFPTTITGPTLSATILMDPHNPGVTTTAGQASVSIRQGTVTTQALFTINPTFPLALGCDLDKTNPRFLYVPVSSGAHLGDWVPPFVLESLFLPFGVVLNFGMATFTTPTPVITQINGAACVTDPIPANNSASVQNPGWLLMNVTIQFVTLPK